MAIWIFIIIKKKTQTFSLEKGKVVGKTELWQRSMENGN